MSNILYEVLPAGGIPLPHKGLPAGLGLLQPVTPRAAARSVAFRAAAH